MTNRPSKRRKRTARKEAAGTFMRLLRDDHAGLSRVLREIDAQQSMLQASPETARPVLAEAMRYLLVYQHSVHHPREDRLFEQIRRREPGLYTNMSRLVREHRSGQQRAEALARELSRATLADLRGRTGQRIAKQLQSYVLHTREHMRREEAVFYTGSERVLRASDWTALMGGAEQRDPAGDLARLSARYPRLAARLSQPERYVTASGESPRDASDDAKHFVERIVEIYGMLAQDAIDVVRISLAELRRVRTPLALLRAAGSISVRSSRLAARVVARPFRR